jgi:hypothetical protein
LEGGEFEGFNGMEVLKDLKDLWDFFWIRGG